jgi:signal transduction histidine kinase
MVVLEASKPFCMLNEIELNALRQIVRERNVSAGEQIFREGDSGDGIYVVKDGLVEISVSVAQNNRRVFAEVGPGELFGEMAVLELKPRSATATAARYSSVYFIPRDELLAMVGRSPALALELLREISQRLRDFNQRYIQEILQTERLAIVGRFARSIVHDLKNPLNIISLTAEVSCMGSATTETRSKASLTIRKQVERVSEMISEILDFTQGSHAGMVLATLDYGAFVQQLMEEIRSDIELKGSRLELEGLPAVSLPMDPKRLRRVFFNLIHNATDAMPEGGRITIRFRVSKTEVITEIEDTGRGIAPEIADKLFEIFATFGKAHGTGLGLSICKKIVEEHGGRIWARNEPGRGALFSFALPIASNRES